MNTINIVYNCKINNNRQKISFCWFFVGLKKFKNLNNNLLKNILLVNSQDFGKILDVKKGRYMAYIIGNALVSAIIYCTEYKPIIP